MKEPTLKDWGKYQVRPAIRVSVSLSPEEWRRMLKYAGDQDMTISALLRAGARKLLKEAKVDQPEPPRW